MTPAEVAQLADVLAPLIIQRVQEQHHEFWIDPESHYNDHKNKLGHLDAETILALKGIASDYKSARGTFWNIFLGLFVVGAIIVAGWAALKGVK